MRRRAKASIAGLILLVGLIAGVTIAAATAPTVTTDDASAVSYTSAHASGRVDPTDQDVTSCRFDYVDDGNYGGSGFDSAASTGCLDSGGNPIDGGNPILAGAGATDVRADLSGLTPNTTYHLRLVADNVDGTTAVEGNTFTTLAVSAPVVTIDSVTTFDSTSAHLTGSVNSGDADPAFDSTYRFEYSTDEANWTALADQGPLTGAGAQNVADDATGLQPNKRYFVRLVASNLGGQTTSDAPNPDFRTLAAPPTVDTGPALFGGSAEARKLTGQVNPNNLPTTYWFEYGTADCSLSACTSVPASQDASAGSGGAPVSVERFINALSPGTTYHYRLVGRNVEGTTAGAGLTFATPALPRPGDGFLPDNRAWEMVSPTDKFGSEVVAITSRTHAAANPSALLPSAITFTSLGGFGDVQGTGIGTEYLSRRTGAPGTRGWSTHAITPKQEPLSYFGGLNGLEPLYPEMSDDLTHGLFRAWSPLTNAPNVARAANLYVREDLRTPGDGAYTLMSDSELILSAFLPVRPFFAGASEDFSHVVFESRANLTTDAGNNSPKLYKSDGTIPRLVSAAPRCPGTTAAACSVAGIGATAFTETPRVISSDGSRVNFTAPIQGNGGISTTAAASSKVFQLDDRGTSTRADDAVVQVSASELASPATTQTAFYQTASTDGSRVFFTTNEQLTDDGVGGLYMWQRQETDESQTVTVDATGGGFSLTFHSMPSTGRGDLSAGSTSVSSTAGSFWPRQTITGTGIPAGTTITAVTNARLTLSAPATASGSQVVLSASMDATTATLAHDAPAVTVEQALSELTAIGEGNVRVTGGPGDAGGTTPYVVTFTGALAGVNVAELSASSRLTGGASTATINTENNLNNLTFIAPLAPELSGVMGASEDGQRAYFTAGGTQLVEDGPELSTPGLYYWQDVVGRPNGSLSFVGAIAALDVFSNVAGLHIWNATLSTARVSPDGGSLVFQVTVGGGFAPRFDLSCSVEGNPNNSATGGCSEVYVYSADSSSPTAPDVVCASCPSDDQPLDGSALLNVRAGAGATGQQAHLNRVISDDGRWVFFSSPDSLVPEDVNGKFDAYRYDTVSDEIHLLSSGTDTADSYFLDSSADGHDAYFLTREALVGWDTDKAADLYDARVDGGFPEPAIPLPVCVGDACQPAGTGSPAPALAGSANLLGPGNAKPNRPIRCTRRQRKVRRGGRARCVKKQSKQTNTNRRAGR